MTEPHDGRALYVTQIADRCTAVDDCEGRPAAVGIARADDAPVLVLIWICDYHVGRVVAIFRDQDTNPDEHIFKVHRTCGVTGRHGTPCGAAGDYLLIEPDAEVVHTVCERHLDEYEPQRRTGWLWS
jgi:hypothetical protein